MIQAIIDTNVIVSALLSKKPSQSIPFLLLSYALEGHFTIVLSEETFQEYQEVLSRSKFQFDADLVKVLLDGIRSRAIIIEPEQTTIELPDEKDRVFYNLLCSCYSETYLITGNLKHFPNCPNAVTPRKFLEIFSNNN